MHCATTDLGAGWGSSQVLNANSAADKQQVVNNFNAKLASGSIAPPCASLLALEFGYDEAKMKASGDGYATLPPKFRLLNQGGEAISKSENTRLTTSHPRLYTASGTKVTNFKKDFKNQCGTNWCTEKHIRGLMVPADMRKLSTSPYMVMETALNNGYFGHRAQYQVKVLHLMFSQDDSGCHGRVISG